MPSCPGYPHSTGNAGVVRETVVTWAAVLAGGPHRQLTGRLRRDRPAPHGRRGHRRPARERAPGPAEGLDGMPDVRVTYAEMESAAKQLITGHQEITTKLSALKTMVDGLVQNGYVTDSSSKAFEASYAEFNKGVTQTIEGLEGMSKYLTAAAKAFGDTDSQLANALK
jgi:WXG100 family type VII secretion target